MSDEPLEKLPKLAGRRPHVDTPVKISVMIPTSLHQKLQILLFDPLKGKVKYGSVSGLIAKLIRDWIEKQKREVQNGN